MFKIIGIDIGSLYTKVVELEIGAKVQLKNSFSFLTPYNTSTSGKAVNRNRLVKELFKEIPLARVKESKVAVNIPFSTPVVITVTLPKMSRKELEVAAITEAKRRMIPAPGPKSVFEKVFLEQTAEGDTPGYEVLIVKDEKDIIDSTTELFKDADVIPALISPGCTAWGSLIAKDSDLKNKEVAFIDLGYNSMDISVSKGPHIIFNQNISFGCKDIIAGVSSGLGVSTEKAEKIVLKEGVPDVDFDPKNRVAIAEEIMRQKYETIEGESSDEVNVLELRMFLEPSIERIVQEVRRTFIYFKERHEARKVEEILFLGGGVLINNLVSVVGKKISPTPKILNVVRLLDLTLKDKRMADQCVFFSTAISLALNITFKPSEIINFLPLELKKREEIAIKRSVFSGVCILIICGFMLSWLNLWISGRNINKSIKRVDFELNRLEDVHNKERELSVLLEKVDKAASGIRELVSNRIDLAAILTDLALAKPKEAVFSQFSLSSKSVGAGKENSANKSANTSSQSRPRYEMILVVKVFSDFEGSCKIMNDFVKQLRQNKQLTGISLQSPQIDEITPHIDKGEDSRKVVRLTDVSWRQFTVTANLNI